MLWCVWLTTGPTQKPCCVCGKRQQLECWPRLTRLQQIPFSSAIISNSDCIRQFLTLQNKFHICHNQCHNHQTHRDEHQNDQNDQNDHNEHQKHHHKHHNDDDWHRHLVAWCEGLNPAEVKGGEVGL